MNETMVTVVGNVATEPELRTTASGKRVVNFRLASSPRYYDKGLSAWRDGETVFWAVSCWRGAAENIADSLLKGQPVVVYGQVKYHSYDDKNGQPRTSLDLEATTVGHDLTKGIATFRKAAGTGREPIPAGEQAGDAGAVDGATSDPGDDGWAPRDPSTSDGWATSTSADSTAA